MKCLIAGASGLVGQNLLNQLLTDPQVELVTAVLRSPLKQVHKKLNSLLSSFDLLDNISLPNADVAFCCLGTTIKKAGSKKDFYKVDHDYILNFAIACHKAGVKKFIVISALGADSTSRVFYNKVKGETEADLLKVNFENLFILRPSLLIGNRTEYRAGEKLAQNLTHIFGPLMLGPLENFRPVKASRVAKKMKELALNNNSGHRIITNLEI